jgi:hypothetical protein
VAVDVEILRCPAGKPFDDQALAGFFPTGGSIDCPVECNSADARIGKPGLRNLHDRHTGRCTKKFVDVDEEYSIGEESRRRQGLFVERKLKLGLSAPVKAKNDVPVMQRLQQLGRRLVIPGIIGQ